MAASSIARRYLASLYQRAVRVAYEAAYQQIAMPLNGQSLLLDCGAGTGWTFRDLSIRTALSARQYRGIEWNVRAAEEGRRCGLNITIGDLNRGIDRDDGTFSCVYALSVLEHLLYPCRFLQECYRVLRPGGRLVLLTPNISTYFTAALILMGKMPSSGPHPDSDRLLKREELVKVSIEALQPDTESDTPVHRHLIVFSYRVLRDYLWTIGFSPVEGRGFGLYPFPNFMQPALERLDPYHCHQMVFVATRPPTSPL